VKLTGSWRRVLLALVLVVAGGAAFWLFLLKMPGKNIFKAAELAPAELTLRDELRSDVQILAGQIGERNMHRYPQLLAAANFIEQSFSAAGLHPRRDSYQLGGRDCYNVEAEITGSSSQIVLIGAHYDSVFGCPGANDNGSGVAALLALARRLAKSTSTRLLSSTLRFVAFVNEEPPYFQTSQMGSFVYASRCKVRGDQIVAMISLETIAYFSDARGSQTYPVAALGAFYPKVGNFIGIVGNVGSRGLVRRAITEFRKDVKIPAEGAALRGFITGVSWSDQWSFWQHGYPGIMITDTAPFRYPHYHEATDTPDKLDYDRFALVVSSSEKLILLLATKAR
jgi:hypothetical protein